MEFRQVFTIALKELRDRLRNRWVLAVALVFTVFALVIAYFGGAQQGAVGLRSIEFTITSLVSLVIYLIPLIALLLGFDAIVGERERGSLDLLLALPITRFELLLGKYLGLAAALSLSTLVGFGLVAVLLATQIGAAGLEPYAGFMFSSVLLGLAFLSLAVMLSVL
ncbi:partial putative ABC transporter permease protein NosY, partial [Burkholderiaceae bacterium]